MDEWKNRVRVEVFHARNEVVNFEMENGGADRIAGEIEGILSVCAGYGDKIIALSKIGMPVSAKEEYRDKNGVPLQKYLIKWFILECTYTFKTYTPNEESLHVNKTPRPYSVEIMDWKGD